MAPQPELTPIDGAPPLAQNYSLTPVDNPPLPKPNLQLVPIDGEPPLPKGAAPPTVASQSPAANPPRAAAGGAFSTDPWTAEAGADQNAVAALKSGATTFAHNFGPWLKAQGQGLKSQFELPHDVMTGQKQLSDPKVMDEAQSLGLNLALGGDAMGRGAPRVEGEVPKPVSEPSLTPIEGEPPLAKPAESTAPKVELEPANTNAPQVKPEPRPQSVGAAATPEPEPLPETPSKSFIKNQEDAFFRLRQSATADKDELSQRVQSFPDELKNPEIQEKFYKAKEDPELQKQFTPQERELYDKYQKPLDREETDLANEIKDAGFGDDEGYVHRIVKGRAPQFDRLAGEATADNPIGGRRSLPKTTSSLQDRVFHVLEDAKGNRKVVALKDGRLSTVEKGARGTPLDAKLTGDTTEITPGAKLNIAGKDFTLKQAKTDEIEKATGLEYYKNAAANTIDNIARLRVTARAVDQVRDLKSSPEWKQYTLPVNQRIKAPSDWITPKMPMFHDTLMDPKLAHVIDDFYGRGDRGPLFETLAKINNFAYRSLFWSPVPHMANVTSDYMIARGWDWLMPSGYKSLALDGPRALREVIGRGPKYQQMLREGSGMVSGGLQNSEFYARIAKALGEDVVKNPDRWNPIIRTLGLSRPADMVKTIYDASSRVMFAYGDMLMMQRVLELERKGMTTRAAIVDAEKHMANYRMPSTVLGSRRIQQGLSDPLLTAFSRYHYGFWGSVAKMGADLVKGNSKEKVAALGNIFVLGAITGFLMPALNHAVQKLTGNPNARVRYPGAATIPGSLLEMYNGDEEFPQFVQNTITLSPLLDTGLQSYQNHDYFGRNIVEPDDVRKGRIGAAAGQEAEHLAGNIVQPYNMLQQAMGGKKSLEQTLRDSSLGISEPNVRGKNEGRKIEAREAKTRRKRPRGLIEELTR